VDICRLVVAPRAFRRGHASRLWPSLSDVARGRGGPGANAAAARCCPAPCRRNWSRASS